MESKKFAWWPVKVTSGETVWLKQYILHRSLYDESTGRPPLTSLYFEWTETLQEKFWRSLTDGVVHNRNIWNTPELTKQDKIKSVSIKH
jgi:hypothetical protein